MSRIIVVACALIGFIAATPANATNGKCEEIRLYLNPVYQQLIQRLQWHLYTRDINLKIDAETEVQAFMKFSQQADRYDKRIINVIRDYNDGNPEAEFLCNKLVLEADCEAYHVYQDAVINLPAINREAVLGEGKRRCDNAANWGPPPIAAPDKYDAVKKAQAATLDRLFFETNRLNLDPISDAETVISAEQKALETSVNQRIRWVGPSGKTSGTIDVVKEIPGSGPSYPTCRCMNLTITTEYSTRTGIEGVCQQNGRWQLNERWTKAGCF